MIVLLDMDEVLADFVGGALAVHGWTRKQLEAVWPAGRWSIVEPMGLTEREFWLPINATGSAFWSNLAQTPWFHGLVEDVSLIAPEWYVVTTPSLDPRSCVGKTHWLRRNLGTLFDRFTFTAHKHLLARPDAVLIDDRQETVERFVAHGGQGILFPSRHNSLWCRAADPVGYVTQQLKQMKERDNALAVS